MKSVVLNALVIVVLFLLALYVVPRDYRSVFYFVGWASWLFVKWTLRI